MCENAAADASEQLTCSRVGCGRPATIIWQETATGESIVYCAEDGVEAFNLVTRWHGHPEQRVNLDNYARAVEKATGRGLYERARRQPPTVGRNS